MPQKGVVLSEALAHLEDQVTNCSLKDHHAWEQLATELSAVQAEVPDTRDKAHGLMRWCGEGLRTLAQGRAADVLALIEALSMALSALAQYFHSDPDGTECLEEAEKAIMEQVQDDPLQKTESPHAHSPQTSGDNKRHDHSSALDDLARELLQLEPDDAERLQAFRGSLQQFAEDQRFSETVRTIITPAIITCEEIVEQRCSDPQKALEEIGLLIEQAMAADENTDDGRKPSAAVDYPAREKEADQGGQPGADEEAIDYMPKDADPDILKEFVTESTELITNAEEALLELENDPDDTESVSTVFRAFHTIKGTSAFLEVSIVSDLAHHAETLLSRVRDGEIRYGGTYAELSLYSIDMLKDLIQGVNNALGGKPLHMPEGYHDLIALLQNPHQEGDDEDTDEEVAADSPRIGDILVAQAHVDRSLIEDAVGRKSGLTVGEELLKNKAVTVKDVAKALRTQKRMKSGNKIIESSVRVQTDRLDRLIDMVGEMVIAHSMIAQDAGIAANKDQELQKKIGHTSKIVRELQDLSMSMRMVPLKSTFQKMARIVRDLANKTGKNVRFVTEGEDTEIDRNMVDLISDPLMHMVRNAVDHGIDAPEERMQRGKPEEGTVNLSAYHSAGNVVVEIRDDGRGLDRAAIVEKAKSKGILSGESSLSEREALQLIFEPGFSTAKTVTDVSGRGVGLDVVKRNIPKLSDFC